jgi:hypothetical protein
MPVRVRPPVHLPPFHGRDTRLRSSLVEVRVLTVARAVLFAGRSVALSNPTESQHDDLPAFSCTDVWDDLGFQVRAAAFDSLSVCLARCCRAAVRPQSRWVTPSLMARHFLLGVAQEQSAWFGTMRPQVRSLSPRRRRSSVGRARRPLSLFVRHRAVDQGYRIPIEGSSVRIRPSATSALSSRAEHLADNRAMEVRFLQGGLWSMPKSSRHEAVTLALVGASPTDHPMGSVDG